MFYVHIKHQFLVLEEPVKYEFCLHLTVVSYEPLEYVFSEQLRITPGSGVLKTPETWVILTAIIGVSSTPDGRGFANPYNGGS